MMLPDDGDALQLQPDPDKLYRYHRQQLSAMLDGELSPDQARFMLRRLEHDSELAGCWERWQVCGDVLRGRHEAPLPADFAAGIARAIAAGAQLPEEQAATVPAAPSRRVGLMRWGGGAALAASVAMAALLVGRQAQAPSEPQPQVAAATSAPAIAPAPVAAPQPARGADQAVDASTLALVSASALAAVEAPRRSERAAWGAAPTATATRSRRQDSVQVAAAAAPAAPALQGSAEEALFAAAAADAVGPIHTAGVSRPWPRAVLGAESPLAAGYGLDAMQVRTFHPFEPQIDARPRPRPALVWPMPVGALGAGLPGDARDEALAAPESE